MYTNLNNLPKITSQHESFCRKNTKANSKNILPQFKYNPHTEFKTIGPFNIRGHYQEMQTPTSTTAVAATGNTPQKT
jgi:hypothetical protein